MSQGLLGLGFSGFRGMRGFKDYGLGDCLTSSAYLPKRCTLSNAPKLAKQGSRIWAARVIDASVFRNQTPNPKPLATNPETDVNPVP